MNNLPTTSYDEVPYDSKPLYSAHPNSLAVAGRLRGVAAAAPSHCRVLELGCATGGNLIPMAYGLPESRFVGVDLSQRQIAQGQKLCQQLELQNIELHAASIADIDRTWGQFDYIICHGVYSWVPPAIRQRILWICRNLLTPEGVAFISYNTYPGWHQRMLVRDLMKFHAKKYSDPQTQVKQAHSIVNFIGTASESVRGPLTAVLAEEAGYLRKSADCYVFHEHLEETNQPFYFHEFVSQARGAGLEYLGEAWNQHRTSDFPQQIQETLETISEDVIELEQYLDFLRCRTFRRTLICQGEKQVVHVPDPTSVEPMLIAPLAHPKSQQPDITSDKPEEFELVDGSSVNTHVPILKAALVQLHEGFPAAVPFQELFERSCRAAAIKPEQREESRQLLSGLLILGYVSHLVALQAEPFPFTTQVSDRPRASRLARHMAAENERLPTLRHEMAIFSPAERAFLRLVDGTRTVDQIAAQAAQLASPETPELAGDCREFVQKCLGRLARNPLLEA